MGKNWRPRRGRNEKSAGDEQLNGEGAKPTWRVVNDLPSCKGLSMVIGTCDAAREREASKELVNLFNQIVEEINSEKPASEDHINAEESNQAKSIQSILQEELDEIRAQSSSTTQRVMSINTNVKGIVCIKFLKSSDSPLEVVQRVFQKVRDNKEACLRYTVRIIPFERVFYPCEEELNENIEQLMTTNSETSTVAVATKNGGSESSGVVESSAVSSKDDGSLTWTESAAKAEVGTSTKSLSQKRKFEDASLEDADADADAAAETQMNKVVVVGASSSSGTVDSSQIESTVPTTSSEKRTIQPIRTSSRHPYSYLVQFKARNHNVLHKGHAYAAVARVVPPNSKLCVTTKCQVKISKTFI